MTESLELVTNNTTSAASVSDTSVDYGYGKLGSRTRLESYLSAANMQAIEFEYDAELRVVRCIMSPSGAPCFSRQMLVDMRAMQTAIRQTFADTPTGEPAPITHLVVSSRADGIYNLGGDLELFADLIEARDRRGLGAYGRLCVDIVHGNANNLNLPISTVALVQGDALGGGFEAALSCDLIVAERSAKMGLPEIIFGTFPGMGGYPLLARRVGAVMAERLITSGRLYSAEELHDLGLVDIVADDGCGNETMVEHLKTNAHRQNVYRSLYNVRNTINPVGYEEMDKVLNIWLDTVMELSPTDVKRMRWLADAQKRKSSQIAPTA